MLEKSDISVSYVLSILNGANLDVALLVPTDTGIKKSIMDATSSVRAYLTEQSIHDYEIQAQGQVAKVVRRAFFVRPDSLKETSVSLYRPKTKNGDPRIWFSRLSQYAEPFNLLAVLVQENKIYLINCSDADVIASLHVSGSPLQQLAEKAKPEESAVVSELLGLVQAIADRGYVRTLRAGDTGIGMTLETLLGITANNRQAPDYKGIEIKSRRRRGNRRQKNGLFSKSPDWKLSPIGNAWNFLQEFGYVENGRLQYYNTLSAHAPNSHGLILELDTGKDWLKQNALSGTPVQEKHVITWPMQFLRASLAKKHKQTFWVSAKCRGRGVDEEFHYDLIEHTKAPNIRNFDALLESGSITVDYTISDIGGRADDHGYLFKIKPKDMNALFPPPQIHVLV